MPEDNGQPDVEVWRIKGNKFEILPQGSTQWAIRRTKRGKAPEWLTWPTKRYETMSGCHYAILLNLEAQP